MTNQSRLYNWDGAGGSAILIKFEILRIHIIFKLCRFAVPMFSICVSKDIKS